MARPATALEQALLAYRSTGRGVALPLKQVVMEVGSSLDFETFRRRFRNVVGDLPELEMCFEWPENRDPVRRRLTRSLADIEIREVEIPVEEDGAAWLSKFLSDDALVPFDALNGPLWRCTWIRHRDRAWVALSVDSLLLDPASLLTWIASLGTEGVIPPSLPAVGTQETAGGWSHPTKSALAETGRGLWAKYLAGCGSPSPIPQARTPESGNGRPEWERIHVELSTGLTQALGTLSANLNMRLRTILEAAWALLIHRFDAAEEVLCTAVRSLAPPGTTSGFGQFQALVPFRATMPPGTRVLNWLRDIEKASMEVEAGVGAGFAEILEWARVPVGSGGFPMLLDLEPAFQPGSLAAGDLKVVDWRERTGYPLTLALRPTRRWLVDLTYDRRLLDKESAGRLLSLWVRLLESMVADGGTGAIDQLEWMTPEEAAIVAHRSRGADRVGGHQPGLVEQIEHHVRTQPQSTAAGFDGRTLQYGELWTRSGAVATRLIERGVHPGDAVPICAERSFELLAGILGILRAGAAYVPLDPAYPESRLGMMLEDVRAKVVLAQRHLAARLPVSPSAILPLEEAVDSTGNPRCPEVVRSPDSPVYVIFTSGSTGRPKGVAMPEGSLTNLLAWQQRNLPTAPGERTLQFAALSFDVSFQEIFSTWIAGATLLLITETLRRDPIALWDFIAKEKVHRIYLPFVGLQQLADVMPPHVASSTVLRDVVTAGEQLRMTPQLRRLFETLNGARLHNHYGPTESHVVTAWTAPEKVSPQEWPALPPIGRPIDGTAVYLLDSRRRLVPEGVPGELYIGGDCLASGYVANEPLTRDRFAHIEIAGVGVVRLYRTGDIGRWRADGHLEYLGRADDQVKIRGHRVELGEVEHVLGSLPGVASCAVVARDHQGQKRLVAYFVPENEADRVRLTTSLRDGLKALLPDYLVPTVFVALTSLPLTPSGKVNRSALPAPDARQTTEPPPLRDHPDPVVRQLAAVWAEVLGTTSFGLNDNFFELGGSSLMVVQVHQRMKENHGRSISIPRLFEHPTLGALARHLSPERPMSADRQAQIVARAALQRAARNSRTPTFEKRS